MNMTYSLPNAKEMILANRKIHTMRTDRQGRWIPGRKIHHCTKPYSAERDGFLTNECIATQMVLLVFVDSGNGGRVMKANIDRRRLTAEELHELAYNDGFDSIAAMSEYFFGEGDEMWAGRIIHWTDKKY